MNKKGIIQAAVAVGLVGGAIYFWLSMNKKDDENTNFAGDDKSLLAENNYPFGQYFKDRSGIVVKSRPYYRRNRGVYGK